MHSHNCVCIWGSQWTHTQQTVRDSTETPGREEKEHYTAPVPSMSNSCPWLPNRVRERKGAKSTKISLSKGATFSSARSNLVVILRVGKERQKDTEKKVQLAPKYRDQFKITLPFNSSWLVCDKVYGATTGLKPSYRNSTTGRQREQMLNLSSPCYMHTSPISATALSYKLC